MFGNSKHKLLYSSIFVIVLLHLEFRKRKINFIKLQNQIKNPEIRDLSNYFQEKKNFLFI